MTAEQLDHFLHAYGQNCVTIARSVSPARIENAKRANERIRADALNALRLLRVELGGKS